MTTEPRVLTGYSIADTYAFVLEWTLAHKGNTPSQRLIAANCGFSIATANSCVHALIREGLLEQIDGELCVVRAAFTLDDNAHHFGESEERDVPDIIEMKTIPASINGTTIAKLKGKGILVGKSLDDSYRQATYPDGWKYEEVEGTGGKQYILVNAEGHYQAVVHRSLKDEKTIVLSVIR